VLPYQKDRKFKFGNQAGVESSIFGEEPYYVALGHITDHKLWENHILDMAVLQLH
jgi:hypothetical protein